MIPVLDLYSDCFGVVWYWYLKVVWQAILILSQTSGQAVTHPSRPSPSPRPQAERHRRVLRRHPLPEGMHAPWHASALPSHTRSSPQHPPAQPHPVQCLLLLRWRRRIIGARLILRLALPALAAAGTSVLRLRGRAGRRERFALRLGWHVLGFPTQGQARP